VAVLENLLEEARKRLVETGTRNRLIHVNRSAKRANVINVINERSDDLFDLLRLQSKKMRFAGKGEEVDETESPISLQQEEDIDESRFTDLIIETPLTPDALQKRLLKIASDARTAEEEQGINILYLNLGFLRWYEDKNSEVMRESPLILIPVELVRNEKTSTFDLKCRDDDIMTNLPLQERLRMDFGVVLPDIDDSEEWTPSDYFQSVADSISARDRWSIDSDGIQLGFFSFAKLLMLRDLDPVNWSEGTLLNNPIIKGLLAEGFTPEPPLFAADANLDEELSPQEIVQVVDADSSQTKVIQEVRSGRNLVVQGPPGTGKSQTITNILAAAAYDNKKVLFVAEKMAALEVVHRRMVKAGLKDLCLELHSRTANKRAFLEEIAETLSNGRSAEPVQNNTDELLKIRDELNQLSNLMHHKVDSIGRSPFQVLSVLIDLAGRETLPPRVDVSHLVSMDLAQEEEMCSLISDFCQALYKYGSEHHHPFRGTKNLDLQPTDLLRLENRLQELKNAVGEIIELRTEVATLLGLEPASTIEQLEVHFETLDAINSSPTITPDLLEHCVTHIDDKRFSEAIQIGADWTSIKNTLSDDFSDVVWTQSVSHIRPVLVQGIQSWFSRVFGKYRSSSKEFATLLKTPLPKNPNERLRLLDTLIDAQGKRESYEQERPYLEKTLDKDWRNERTPFIELRECASWLEENKELLSRFSFDSLTSLLAEDSIKQRSSSQLESLEKSVYDKLTDTFALTLNDVFATNTAPSADLEQLLSRIDGMIHAPHLYDAWVAYSGLRTRLEENGLNELIPFAETHPNKPETILAEFIYGLNESRWNVIRQEMPSLNQVAKTDRHLLVERFQQLESERIKQSQNIIRSQHLTSIPQGSVGEMGVIRGEIAKKRKHFSIRKVMSLAGSMVQRIKPVFLMSPISVAQFLPPEKLEFDLLVIDEASQVRPEDALGSIARARQIVVVGDQKQLPPTSFFDRLTGNMDDFNEDEETEEIPVTSAVEMESVLSLCEARGLSESMLEWHYRSRDPSLITVSNIEFYRNRLILPPSPMESDDSFGLNLIRVPGVYSSASRGNGRPGTNRIEAEQIVNRLCEFARTRSEFSVGIVTFSKAQADMVTEVLEFTRRNDPTLDQFLQTNKTENVFVKNIENVQGDERDIILISVGYGPYEPNGRLPSMSFGPINSEGGERRLNVLFSRSRVACEVFTSFDPRDIDLNRTQKLGPRVLKKFLQFAETGELAEKLVTGEDADSPFEEDVARVIRSIGFEVDHQVGTAGFRIDLGVRSRENPAHYILAVECDGATYHSALWARERDRLRQQILEGFGWTFHRIWSTDWFYRRTQEIERLKRALEHAETRDIQSSLKGANELTPSMTTVTREAPSRDRVDLASLNLEPKEIDAPTYKKAVVRANSFYEPHERPISEICDLVSNIINVEGPIHTDEIARRYTAAHGKSRVGNRIEQAVLRALLRMKKQNLILESGQFWGTEAQFKNPPVRNRQNELPPLTKPEYISAEEIRACAEIVSQESGDVDLDEMIRAVSRVLGFKRAGPDFQMRVRQILCAVK
jgi:very-short-patch-repair endonuclease